MIGLYSSYPCPPQFIMKAYDLAKVLREGKVGIIGGFQSSLEKDLLDILLRGETQVIICLARSQESYRVPVKLREGFASGRLRIIAPELRLDQSRITLETVAKRDALILQLCSRLIVVYARPGGKVEKLCLRGLEEGKVVQAIDDQANRHLFERGVIPIS